MTSRYLASYTRLLLQKKTLPERDDDVDLLEKVYQHLFQRALQLKETLRSGRMLQRRINLRWLYTNRLDSR